MNWEDTVTFLAFFALIAGIIGLIISVRTFVRYMKLRAKVYPKRKLIVPKKEQLKRRVTLIVSSALFFGSLLWMVIFNPFDSYYLFAENAVSDDGVYYEFYKRIDTNISSTPILLSEVGGMNLSVVTVKTKKSLFGIKKYCSNERIHIVGEYDDGEVQEVIDETRVYHSEDLPDIRFGVVYPDQRDRIRVNGNKPILHDIRCNNQDYVFWYIERDSAEAILTFIQ